MVLIAVSQQRIGDAVKELIVELGHTDHTQVKERQGVRQAAAALGPLVAPCATGDDTGVLGSGLIVKVDGECRRGLYLALEGTLEERCHELGERDTQLGRILAVVVVDQAAQIARQALIGNLGLGTEHLGTLEQVAVLIVQADAESQVALAVGALK